MKRSGKPVGVERPKPLPKWWKAEYDWAFANYSALAKRYANQWIAFAKGQVLAHGNALMPVLDRARRKIHQRDIPHLFVERGIHIYVLARLS